MKKTYKKKVGGENTPVVEKAPLPVDTKKPEKMIINGVEWCPCEPPKPSLNPLEKLQSIGDTANQGLKNFQEEKITQLKDKGNEIAKGFSDTFRNAANRALGNEDKVVAANPPVKPEVKPEANPVVKPEAKTNMYEDQGGGRKHIHCYTKHKHSHKKNKKYCHSKHKHSKHKHSKHKHSKHKHSKHKHSKRKTQKRR